MRGHQHLFVHEQRSPLLSRGRGRNLSDGETKPVKSSHEVQLQSYRGFPLEEFNE